MSLIQVDSNSYRLYLDLIQSDSLSSSPSIQIFFSFARFSEILCELRLESESNQI